MIDQWDMQMNNAIIDQEFIQAFWQTFSVVFADSDDLKLQAYRLRYQSYCLERQYEEAGCFPDGLEKDHYDEQSEQVLLYHRPSRQYVGVVRVILPLAGHRPLPVASISNDPAFSENGVFKPKQACEISRFTLSHKLITQLRQQARSKRERRILASASMGLVSGAIELARDLKADTLFMLLDPLLRKRLQQQGIFFSYHGETVDFHGPRIPCAVTIDELMQLMFQRRPEQYALLLAQLEFFDYAGTDLTLPAQSLARSRHSLISSP
jgi:N-acyl amino acid synthase of PEP-CTERM/exosortase system